MALGAKNSGAHESAEVAESRPIASPFAKGDIIAGKYVVERLIGIGGVGLVLAARHRELDEMVAIKLLRPDALARPELVRRFSREAKAAVRIKSEYAARVFDTGVLPEKGPYMVMEYLEGQDLGALTDGRAPMPVRRAVEFIMQACEAIAVAHSLGIIHRDIKPENLFLARRPDGSEIVKVLDFGISKTALAGAALSDAPMERTQELMGSPYYMSPEQFRGTAAIDHRTDIWSLGVVLYELLTCTQPFGGDTVPAVCSAVLEETPKPLRHHIVDVPPGLQDVMDRCLEKNTTKRFQNVAEVAIALLPFAPSNARVFAERTSGILHAADRSVVTFRYDSAAPPPRSGNPASQSIPGAPLVPNVSSLSPPQSLSSTSPEALAAITSEARKTRGALLAVVAIVIGGAGAVLSFSRDKTPARPEAPAAAVAAAHPVVVESEPKGARVEWDGKLLGETPGTFQLPPGQHEITVSRDGFKRERLSVTVAQSATDSPRLHITLQVEPVVEKASTPPSTKAPLLVGPRGGAFGPKSATPPTSAAVPKPEPVAQPAPPPEPAVAAPAAPPPTTKVKTIKDAPAPTTHVKVIGDKKTDVKVVE